MSDQITNFYVQQYTTNIQMLLQQEGSRLRSAVMEGRHVGKQAVPVDQVGEVSMTQRTTRYPSLTPGVTPTDRRWVFPSDFDWNDLIDSIDKLRLLTDPQSHYVRAGTMAAGRTMDNLIIDAFFADSKTGETGSTTTSFPAGNQVAATVGAAAATGMNVAKLRAAKRLLMAADVDVDSEQLFCAITAEQHDDLLNETQAISLDFNTKPVLVEGRITSFMGFNFIHTELLDTDGTYRRCPVWAKSGMHLGVWNDISTDVSQRKDLAGLPWQVYVHLTAGATRTEEGRVIEIKCAE